MNLAADLYKQISIYVLNSDTKACFKLGSPAKISSGYDQNSNSIYFDGIENIKKDVVVEEFFHFYQDLLYDGLPYGTGRSNIEFEVKLYHDLNHGGDCFLAFEEPDTAVFTEYLIWLSEVSNCLMQYLY